MTWQDAKEFTALIPGVKDALQAVESGTALVDRVRNGDSDACYREWSFKKTTVVGGEVPAAAPAGKPVLKRSKVKDFSGEPSGTPCPAHHTAFMDIICLKDCD